MTALSNEAQAYEQDKAERNLAGDNGVYLDPGNASEPLTREPVGRGNYRVSLTVVFDDGAIFVTDAEGSQFTLVADTVVDRAQRFLDGES